MRSNTLSQPGTGRKLRVAVLALLGLGVGLLAADTAQAGNLDQEMIKAAKKCLKEAQRQGWKNVGVLKFRVKAGKEKQAGWNEGRFNSLLATRLENALLLVSEGSVGITRSAGDTAIQRLGKKVDYIDTNKRKMLFTVDYPLIVGAKPARVDAFFTGYAEVSPNMKKIDVVVRAWDKKNLTAHKVTSFQVTTDRIALTEMNRSFVVKRIFALNPRDNDIDGLAVDSVNQQQAKPTDPPTTQTPTDPPTTQTPTKPTDPPTTQTPTKPIDEYLDFKIVYGDKTMDITKNGETFQVETPTKDTKVRFDMKSTKEARLAVVLLVNGVNTFREETSKEPPTTNSMWVLKKDVVYSIKGFYPSEKAPVKPFQVLPDDESQSNPLADGEKGGRIEVLVFIEGGTTTTAGLTGTRGLRGFSTRATSYTQALAQLQRSMKPKNGKRGLIISGAPGENANIELEAFQNPVLVAGQTIVYYQKNK